MLFENKLLSNQQIFIDEFFPFQLVISNIIKAKHLFLALKYNTSPINEILLSLNLGWLSTGLFYCGEEGQSTRRNLINITLKA